MEVLLFKSSAPPPVPIQYITSK